jgi:hypothetical protein
MYSSWPLVVSQQIGWSPAGELTAVAVYPETKTLTWKEYVSLLQARLQALEKDEGDRAADYYQRLMLERMDRTVTGVVSEQLETDLILELLAEHGLQKSAFPMAVTPQEEAKEAVARVDLWTWLEELLPSTQTLA